MGRTVHGLHYQKASHCEKKLVACTWTKVWDVALDLRKGSPTILQWDAEIFSPESVRLLLMPKGFAHEFETIVPDVEMLYLHSVPDHPSAEFGISPMDFRLRTSWPEPLAAISNRDKSHPPLAETFLGLTS